MLSQKTPMKNIGTALLAGIAAFSLLLMMTVSVFANTVHIYDKAGVLNASQVQSNAANLPYDVDIYTVNTFTGDRAAFQQETATHTANNPRLVVIAIDTVHHFVDVKAGSQVQLSNNNAQAAVNAFVNSYKSGGYTGATNAALGSLQNSLSVASGSGSNGSAPPVQSQGGLFSGIGFSALCGIGLLVLAGVAVFAFVRRRSQPTGGGFGWFNQRRANIPPQEPYYNQPYNQGYPPNYGPGYPGYNQGGGINPLAAGGLGAAAGGLIGYELGKEAGERQGNEQGNQGNQGNDYGNNNGGNFGGGASGDFGGGNNGGGDFGGGGGGDFGGGGGGGDFGGGGGGSF